MKFINTLILGLLLSMTVAAQVKPADDPLKPLSECNPGSGLEFLERVRYVGTRPIQREVTTARGTEKVPVVDGYHVAFRFDDLHYKLVSVKIEESDEAVYLRNKLAIISSLKFLSTSEQATPIAFTDKSMLNGFEHYSIDRDRIDAGEVLGTHVLFYDADRLMVTVYFLNQPNQDSVQRAGGKRKVTSIEQYRALRDDFLANYSQCLENAVTPQP